MNDLISCRIIDGGYNNFEPLTPPKTPCFYLLAVEDGVVEEKSDTKTSLIKGNFYVFASNLASNFIFSKARYYYLAFELKSNKYNVFDEKIIKKPYDLIKINHVVNLINNLRDKNLIKNTSILLSVLSNFLYEQDPIKDFSIEEVINYVDENYTEQLSLSSLSKKFNYTENRLIIKFKEKTGLTPIKYIINKKIETAKALLKNKSATINSVMESVGFLDASYFSKIFKKRVGCSPKDYKNSLIKD